MILSNRGSGYRVFDKETFPNTIGETSENIGIPPGHTGCIIDKETFEQNHWKTNGNQHFLQAWEFLSHRVPCPIHNWNELKWIGEE